MNTLFYFALFHTAEEGGFWVSFPDFPECFTQGETLQETYAMAVDALGLCVSEYTSKDLPKPSLPSDITVPKGATLALVSLDLAAYRRKHNTKAVKKTLSIPEWLNEEALALGINFSQVLQEALLQKIGQK